MSRSNYDFANYQSSSSGYQLQGGYQPKGGGYAPTTRGGGHGLQSSSTLNYTPSKGKSDEYEPLNYTPSSDTDVPSSGEQESPHLSTSESETLNYTPHMSGGGSSGSSEVDDEPEVMPELQLDPKEVSNAERNDWHSSVKQRTTMPTVSLDSHYHGEMDNKQQPGTLAEVINKKKMLGTYYASSPEEYGTQVVDGSLQKGGKKLDSSKSKAVYRKDRNGRNNFALNGAGDLFTSDVRTELDKHSNKTEGYRHNHSSLVGGGDVTAAGTLSLKDGKVTSIDDESGHYKPNMTQTYEAVKHLRDRNAFDKKAKVELGGKGEEEKMFGSSVDEFMRYEDVIHKSRQKAQQTGDSSHLKRPEQLLRKELGARRGLEAELSSGKFQRKMESAGTKRMKAVKSLEQGLQNKRASQLHDMWAESNPKQQALSEQDLNEPTTELPELQLDPNELQEQPLEMLNLEPQQLEELEQEVESEDADQGGVTNDLEKDYTEKDYTEKNYLEKNYLEKNYTEVDYRERN